jgi:hypothetical protein
MKFLVFYLTSIVGFTVIYQLITVDKTYKFGNVQ